MRKIVFAGYIMSNKEIRRYARTYFLPFVLGSNKSSHRLCAKMSRKYGVEPIVLDKKRSVYDFFSLSSRFVPLCDTEENEIISDELLSIAQKYDSTLPILISCSPRYTEMLNAQSGTLETVFVLCDADKVFSDSPLADIP